MSRVVLCGNVNRVLGGNVKKYAGNEEFSGDYERVEKYLIEKYKLTRHFDVARRHFMETFAINNVEQDINYNNIDVECILENLNNNYDSSALILPARPQFPVSRTKKYYEAELRDFMESLEEYYIDKIRRIYELIHIYNTICNKRESG